MILKRKDGPVGKSEMPALNLVFLSYLSALIRILYIRLEHFYLALLPVTENFFFLNTASHIRKGKTIYILCVIQLTEFTADFTAGFACNRVREKTDIPKEEKSYGTRNILGTYFHFEVFQKWRACMKPFFILL